MPWLICSLDYPPIWYIPIYQNSSIYFEANISAAPLSRNVEIFPGMQSPIFPRALFVFTLTFEMVTLLVFQKMSSLKTLTMNYFYFHCFIVASPQKVFALVEEVILWYMYFTVILFTKYGYYRIWAERKGSSLVLKSYLVKVCVTLDQNSSLLLKEYWND